MELRIEALQPELVGTVRRLLDLIYADDRVVRPDFLSELPGGSRGRG